MRYFIMIIIIMLLISHASCGEDLLYQPLLLSHRIVNLVNSDPKSTWTAGHYPQFDSPGHVAAIANCAIIDRVQPPLQHPADLPVPQNFDARQKWPKCRDVINEIGDQGSCGSCWAMSSAGAMSDRICVHSAGSIKLNISTEDVLACTGQGFGCNGGSVQAAHQFWCQTGAVTGGGYHSNSGCLPYSFPPGTHSNNSAAAAAGGGASQRETSTPECKKLCRTGYHGNYNSDKHYGKSNYAIVANVTKIQQELQQNGPVVASMDVYEDLLTYKTGVYQHKFGANLGPHAVRLIGWGVADQKISYWLAANTWNLSWGEDGKFRIVRGNDECGIESNVIAGLPKL